MLQHYVEFGYPGSFFSETGERKVKTRKGKITIPENAFGYRYFDREETKIKGETLRGKDKNYSHWTYKGKEMSLADVKREMGDKNILISNMENNGYTRIVSVFGRCFPLNKEDVVLKS